MIETEKKNPRYPTWLCSVSFIRVQIVTTNSQELVIFERLSPSRLRNKKQNFAIESTDFASHDPPLPGTFYAYDCKVTCMWAYLHNTIEYCVIHLHALTPSAMIIAGIRLQTVIL